MAQRTAPSTVLLLINDLIFETKIRSTAQSLGINIAAVRSAADLERSLPEARAPLIVVDLNTADDAIRAIEATHAHRPRPTILAYVSHVDTALLDRAREAGADHVLPRSRFNQELPRLLADLTPSDESAG